MPASQSVVAHWFDAHRGFLWGLCYRITGSPADADDVVQEAFVRALKSAPEQLDEPRRWLVKVAVNVSRDVLRRRRRREYVGTWLPGPIETGALDEIASPDGESARDHVPSAENGYDLTESVSLAFLQALEALTPTQRAVLLLRDVFDYSAAETADALDLSEGNVRTTHHRARRTMSTYDRTRVSVTRDRQSRASKALGRFLELLGRADVRGIERMLAADVHAATDDGGEFTASRRAVIGRSAVARFFARLAASRTTGPHVRRTQINGAPAAVFEFGVAMGRRPPRLVLAAAFNDEGLISSLWVIASARKLTAIPRSVVH